MKLITTARHFEASPDLIEYTEKRLIKLKHFFDHILHVDAIMSVEKFRHIAEVNVHVNGHDFTAKEESEDMKTSIDKVAKSLERQMKKFKGKIILNHHKTKKSGIVVGTEEKIIRSGSVGSEGGLELIEQVPRDVPVLSMEEAIIMMEDQEKHFLIFNNKELGKLSIVYSREDGHYGVIGA
ncbi:MAG: ribosome-associated translation inhibitor RaiA [Candidatus Krumholzibacteria bacterium]|nr:ribosome-associated translation inhibitor RaiA [Candidatus Krumholzibacteria bacterium]